MRATLYRLNWDRLSDSSRVLCVQVPFIVRSDQVCNLRACGNTPKSKGTLEYLSRRIPVWRNFMGVGISSATLTSTRSERLMRPSRISPSAKRFRTLPQSASGQNRRKLPFRVPIKVRKVDGARSNQTIIDGTLSMRSTFWPDADCHTRLVEQALLPKLCNRIPRGFLYRP
jgi:hypothetical protein